MVAINGRFLGRRITGVERYAHEISKRLRIPYRMITPFRPNLTGLAGHAWEQTILPVRLKGSLLWSPCNIGPLAVRNQVVTVHDIIVIDHPEWFAPNFVRIYHELIPRLLMGVRHIITVSEYSKERILARFAIHPDKVTVIPNGVSESFAPTSLEKIARVRTLHQIPEGPYLLTVSSREPRKNLISVLRAWEQLRNRTKNVSLVIAGGSENHSVFMNQAGLPNFDNVIYTGYIKEENLPALYSGCVGFVYPSLCEGFGLPVLEALGCGVPVITSNSSALRELNGGGMILVDPLEIGQIAQAIEKLLGDELTRYEIAQLCRAHALTFTWGRTAELTEQLLSSFSA